MSFIKYEYININKFSRPGIKNYGIKGLIMHYTANNGGTARNHKTYFNNLNGIYASAHLFVDDDEAICIIPLNEVAYHANDTVKYNADGTIYKPLYSKIGNANYGAIGLEMCLNKNGNITEKTFQNAVKAVKELVAKYPTITRNTIWRHYDVTGKNCPAPWVAKPSELERFKEAVFGKNSSDNNTSISKPTASTSFKVGDKVKITDALYKDSTGAGRSTASRGKIGTIKRVVSGNKPYLIDSLGWAHKNDIQLATSSTTTATKKVGDTVTVQSHAAKYQTGQNIPSWVKGKKYKIKQIKSVNQSKSKKAYLLDGINSWFLEQDVK